MRVLDNKDRVGGLLLLAFSVAYLRYAWVLPVDPTAADEAFSAKTLPIGLAVTATVGVAVYFVGEADGAGPASERTSSAEDLRH